MRYRNVLSRIYGLVPKGIRLGLDRVERAAGLLGSPQSGLPCVQIAGTNGKGSAACMLDAGAREAGLKVGLFTSPHLHRFAERIRIDGEEANEDDLSSALSAVLDISEGPERIPLTFFETATLAGLVIFARRGVDLAILEVGLGGRLDATSICEPSATVITSIGKDHTEILGDSIEAIAGEKAAIARRGVAMVTGPLPPAARDAVRRVAAGRGAPLSTCGIDFQVDEGLRVPLPGLHQRVNASVASAAFEELGRVVDPRLTGEAFAHGLESARWPGRFEIVERGDRYILDGAHNAEAVDALIDALERTGEAPTRILFGVLEGKPVDRMVGSLKSLGAEIFMVPPPIGRAADHRILASRFETGHFATFGDALDDPRGADGTTLVTGSLFAVGEARRLLLGEETDPPVGL